MEILAERVAESDDAGAQHRNIREAERFQIRRDQGTQADDPQLLAGGAQTRDAVAAHLKSPGIATAVYYPRSLHLQPVYAALGHRRGDFPASEAAQDEVLSLPMYPELPEEHAKSVVDAIRSYFA